MPTWTVSRNNHVNEASNYDRAKQTLILIKDRLLAATVPWVMIGYGRGTGSGSYVLNSGGVSDPFGTFPAITNMNNLAWIVFKNADGVQLVLQVASNNLYMQWSMTGDYTTGAPASDADEDTRPGSSNPPTDEVDHGTSYMDVGYSAAHYKSIATSDDGKSFISFGKYATSGSHACVLVALENTKTGDTHPYWSLRSDYSSGAWTDSILDASSGDYTKGYHPSGGAIRYNVPRLYVKNSDVMDYMLPDPFTGDEQLIESLCICPETTYYHIRGKIPGIYRNANARSMGDTFSGGDFMCMDDFAVPWESATDPLQ